MFFNSVQRATLNQLGRYLPDAKNYEIRYPVKPTLRVYVTGNLMNAVQDVHSALRGSGLDYRNMYLDGNVVVVEGIRFEAVKQYRRQYRKVA